MGKKKSNERGGSGNLGSSRGAGQGGLSDTGMAAVVDAGLEQVEDAAAAAAANSGGARTTNPQLQARLDLLAEFARRGDLRSFVRVFVPHDLTQEDIDYFASELESDPSRWEQLKTEVTLIADGSRVHTIVGDQRTRAEFRYFMPNQSLNINREVVFVCENGDWRAEG